MPSRADEQEILDLMADAGLTRDEAESMLMVGADPGEQGIVDMMADPSRTMIRDLPGEPPDPTLDDKIAAGIDEVQRVSRLELEAMRPEASEDDLDRWAAEYATSFYITPPDGRGARMAEAMAVEGTEEDTPVEALWRVFGRKLIPRGDLPEGVTLREHRSRVNQEAAHNLQDLSTLDALKTLTPSATAEATRIEAGPDDGSGVVDFAKDVLVSPGDLGEYLLELNPMTAVGRKAWERAAQVFDDERRAEVGENAERAVEELVYATADTPEDERFQPASPVGDLYTLGFVDDLVEGGASRLGIDYTPQLLTDVQKAVYSSSLSPVNDLDLWFAENVYGYDEETTKARRAEQEGLAVPTAFKEIAPELLRAVDEGAGPEQQAEILSGLHWRDLPKSARRDRPALEFEPLAVLGPDGMTEAVDVEAAVQAARAYQEASESSGRAKAVKGVSDMMSSAFYDRVWDGGHLYRQQSMLGYLMTVPGGVATELFFEGDLPAPVVPMLPVSLAYGLYTGDWDGARKNATALRVPTAAGVERMLVSDAPVMKGLRNLMGIEHYEPMRDLTGTTWLARVGASLQRGEGGFHQHAVDTMDGLTWEADGVGERLFTDEGVGYKIVQGLALAGDFLLPWEEGWLVPAGGLMRRTAGGLEGARTVGQLRDRYTPTGTSGRPGAAVRGFVAGSMPEAYASASGLGDTDGLTAMNHAVVSEAQRAVANGENPLLAVPPSVRRPLADVLRAAGVDPDVVEGMVSEGVAELAARRLDATRRVLTEGTPAIEQLRSTDPYFEVFQQVVALEEGGKFEHGEAVQMMLAMEDVAEAAVREGRIDSLEAYFETLVLRGTDEVFNINDAESGALTRQGGRAPVFYSAVDQGLSRLFRGDAKAMKGQSLLAKLKKQPNVKQEEIDLLGLDEFLAGAGRVTEEEARAFIEPRRIRVEEVVKGEEPAGIPEARAEFRAAVEKTREALRALEARGREIQADQASELQVEYDRLKSELAERKASGNSNVGDPEFDEFYSRMERVYQTHKTLSEGGGGPMVATPDGHMLVFDVQLTGEVVVYLPADARGFSRMMDPDDADAFLQTPEAREAAGDLLRLSEDAQALFGAWKAVERKYSALRRARDENATKWGEHVHPGGDGYRELLLTLQRPQPNPSWTEVPAGPDYMSSHWDEPNILAHVRYDTVYDESGRKVLRLHEVQSDWHQEGRDEGYHGQGLNSEQVRKSAEPPDDKGWVYGRNHDGRRATFGTVVEERPGVFVATSNRQARDGDLFQEAFSTEDEAVRWLAQGASVAQEKSHLVPDAPFKDTWHSLAMKRMVRYAAENGYDAIAWPTGVDEAELMSVGGRVDRVEWVFDDPEDVESGRLEVSRDGDYLEADLGGSSWDNLEQYIGKEPAERLREEARRAAAGGRTDAFIEGDDLRANTAGMEAFYDEKLPNWARKFGKRYGARVDHIEIPRVEASERFALWTSAGDLVDQYEVRADAEARIAEDPHGQYRLVEHAPQRFHAMTITPKMRRAVLEEGLPLFQKGGAPTPEATQVNQQRWFHGGPGSTIGDLQPGSASNAGRKRGAVYFSSDPAVSSTYASELAWPSVDDAARQLSRLSPEAASRLADKYDFGWDPEAESAVDVLARVASDPADPADYTDLHALERDVSRELGEDFRFAVGGGGAVRPARVDVRNPKVVDWNGGEWTAEVERIVEQAGREGHDAVLFRNIVDRLEGSPGGAAAGASDVLAVIDVGRVSDALFQRADQAGARGPGADRAASVAHDGEVSEQGVIFRTGQPVTLRYARNTESAPDMGERYGQHIEPAGRYLIHNENPGPPDYLNTMRANGWEYGEVSFQRPLVVPLNTDADGAAAGPGSWKVRLSEAYGGLTGRALSEAVAADGYDSIVTVSELPGGRGMATSEIVDLTGFDVAAPVDELAEARSAAGPGRGVPEAEGLTPPDGDGGPLLQRGDDTSYADRRSRVRSARDFPDNLLPNLSSVVPERYLRDLPYRPGQKTVTVYRSVPGDVDEIRPGDWVALRRSYAKQHGRGKVLAMEVPAEHVMWAGTDMDEFFYVPPDEAMLADDGALLQRAADPDDPQNLVVQHNLYPQEVLAAMDLGGLAVPSIAVARIEYPVDKFGTVSLLGGTDLVDPKKGVPTFDADVYSPTFPQREWKVDKRAARRWEEANLYEKQRRFGDTYADLEEAAASDRGSRRYNELADSPSMRALYIERALGQEFVPVEDVRLDMPGVSDDPRVRDTVAAMDRKGWYNDWTTEAAQADVERLSNVVSTVLDEQAGVKVADKVAQGRTGRAIDQERVRRLLRQGVLDDDGVLEFAAVSRLLSDWERLERGARVDQLATARKAGDTIEQSGGGWAAYQDWLDQTLDQFRKEPVFSPKSGGRQKAYTLGNIVREIRRELRGADGLTGDLGRTRSFGARRFGSLDEVKGARDSIVPPAEVEAAAGPIKERFFAVVDQVQEFGDSGSRWRNNDAVEAALVDHYKTGRPLSESLRRNGFEGVPSDVVEEFQGVADDLRTMVTGYFEAKPQRAVGFEEFRAAVVPKDADAAVRQRLEEAGLKVYEYDPEVDGDRAAVTRQAAAENDLLFQRRDGDDESVRGSFLPEDRSRFRDPLSAARAFITLYRDGKFDTGVHETFGHHLEWLMGEEWMRRATQVLESENGVLTKDGREQFARAAERYFERNVAPTGQIQRLMVAYKHRLAELWLRYRHQPAVSRALNAASERVTGKGLDQNLLLDRTHDVGLPPEVEAMFDGIFRPDRVASRYVVEIGPARLDKPLPSVTVSSDPAMQAAEGKVRSAQSTREFERVNASPEAVRQALGIKTGDEIPVDELVAKALGYVITEQFRRKFKGEPLVRMTTRTVVPQSRVKRVQTTARTMLEDALGDPRDFQDAVDGDRLRLSPGQQLGLRRLADRVAAEPLGDLVPDVFLDDDADLSTVALADINRLQEAVVDVSSGVAARRDRRAEAVPSTVVGALYRALTRGFERDDPAAATAAVAGGAGAGFVIGGPVGAALGGVGGLALSRVWPGLEQRLQTMFVTKGLAEDYVDPHAQEIVARGTRRVGRAQQFVLREGKRLAKEGGRDLGYTLDGLRRQLNPPVDPGLVLWLSEAQQKLQSGATVSEIVTPEWVKTVGRIFDDRVAATPLERTALQALLAHALGHAGDADGITLPDALGIVDRGIRRRLDLVDQDARDIALIAAGSEDANVLVNMEPHVLREAYDYFYTGKWDELMAWTSRQGLHAAAEEIRQSKGGVRIKRTPYNPDAAILQMLVRMKAREELDAMGAELVAYGLRLTEDEIAEAGGIGPNAAEREAFVDRVIHYLNNETSFKQSRIYNDEGDLVQDVPLPEGEHDEAAYSVAHQIMSRLGFKHGKGATWQKVQLSNGEEVVLPSMLAEGIEDAMRRGADIGGAWGSNVGTGGFARSIEKAGLSTRRDLGAGASSTGTQAPAGAGSKGWAKNLEVGIDLLSRVFPLTPSRLRMGVTVGPLVPNAPYYVAAALGGLLQAYSGGGIKGATAGFRHADIVGPVMARMWGKGYRKPSGKVFVTKTGTIYTPDMLADLALDAGLDSSFVKAEGSRALAKMMGDLHAEDWYRQVIAAGAGWQQAMMDAATAVDNFYRLGLWLDELYEGRSLVEAADVSKRAMFDYADLTDDEAGPGRTVIMFYPYLRKASDLFLWTLANHPHRVMGQLRLTRGLQRMFVDEEDPELYLHDAQEGRLVWGAVDPLVIESHRSSKVAFLSPPTPTIDALRIYLDLYGTLQGDEDAMRGVASMVAPWWQAVPVGLGVSDEEWFSGRDLRYAAEVPSHFVMLDRVLTGGAVVDSFLRVKPDLTDDTGRYPVEGSAVLWKAQNERAWWALKNLGHGVPGMGRQFDLFSRMDRANLGPVEAATTTARWMHPRLDSVGYYRAWNDALGGFGVPEAHRPAYRPVAGGDTAGPRSGMTSTMEILGATGAALPTRLPTKEAAEERVDDDLFRILEEEIRARGGTPPR